MGYSPVMPAAALAALGAAGVRVRLEADGTVRLAAAAPPPPNVLALARAHRDGIAALLAGQAPSAARVALVPLPGVPPEWCEGVARLATLPAPDSIPPARWAVLAATSVRLLRDHGAELHAAGWTVLDLFGLHVIAPAAYPPGWGLAWLLGEAGRVLDVSPAVVGFALRPGAARLAHSKQQAPAQAGCSPSWTLPRVAV